MTEEEKKVEETTEEAAPAEETKTEDAADAGAEVEVPEKFKEIVAAIEEMSVLELNELVKLFEKKFGVSAAAVAVAGAGAAAGGEAEEKTSFTVELTSFGEAKIGVIKAVKEILGLGLKEAKELVEGAPVAIKEDAKKEEADEIKAKVEEAGGTVTLK